MILFVCGLTHGVAALALATLAAAAPLALGALHHRRHLALLREGTPGLALVSSTHPDALLLEYLDLEGDVRTREVRPNALGTLGDERLEPVLFTHDADVALDEMLHVTVDHGAISVTPRARARALLALAAHLAACAALTASRLL